MSFSSPQAANNNQTFPGKVLYFFKSGRKQRLLDPSSNPTEFFYGYQQLINSGLSVELFDEDELALQGNQWRVTRKGISQFARVTGINVQVLGRLLQSAILNRVKDFEFIIATTNTFGIHLAFLKRVGLLHGKLIFIPMGLYVSHEKFPKPQLYRWLFRDITLAVISKGEFAYLEKILGANYDLRYLPFGVDHRFWEPNDKPASQRSAGEAYVLSVGNDRHRDYSTLVRAWKEEYPLLKIITRLSIEPPLPDNVQVIAGDWRQQLLTDAQIRELFQNSLFVILPLKETIQPSGQSACLQAMACGKAVILSNIQGLWDRELMVNRQNCLLVTPEVTEELQAATETLLQQPKLAESLGHQARQMVVEHLNVDVMANHLMSMLR